MDSHDPKKKGIMNSQIYRKTSQCNPLSYL